MTTRGTDNIYAQPLHQVSDFSFDQHVVEVFPDMIQRSVPGYATIVSTIGELAARYAQPNSRLYDLGCSLGAATISMRRGIQAIEHAGSCKIIGVDNSSAMVERCRLHVEGFRSEVDVQIIEGDINNVALTDASVVVMNFTMQFLQPQQRDDLVKRIYGSLKPGGIFILSEKFSTADNDTNELLIDLHHEFKRANGYSELEISQKRSALENVMKVDSIEAHHNRMSAAGFSHVQTWYQCFNFCSMVAIK